MTLEEHIFNLKTERQNWVRRRQARARNTPAYDKMTHRIRHIDEKLGYLQSCLKRKEDKERTDKIKALVNGGPGYINPVPTGGLTNART